MYSQSTPYISQSWGTFLKPGDTPSPPAGSILHLFFIGLIPTATAIAKAYVIPNTPVIPNLFRNLKVNTGMLKQVQHDNMFSV